mgnify:CR=1 FL=1
MSYQRTRLWYQRGLAATVAVALAAAFGCGGSGTAFTHLFYPFPVVGGDGTTGPGSTGRQSGTPGGSQQVGFLDPCSEPQTRKFVRITMRNQSEDYIHYFLVMIAYVNGEEYPDGAVCETDVPLYTAFGYTLVPRGSEQAFGNVCVRGPALLYFHRAGQFRTAGGVVGASLGSAIGPAQGATPTYDNFFSSAGALVPVPNLILFHNPGTTSEGRTLRVSFSNPTPCDETAVSLADPACEQDAFYYVDESDRQTGSAVLGAGSGRRVPAEIQGTGCECRGIQQPYQVLAPSARTALSAACDEFFRGGRIDYVFVRTDTDPPFPQLVWRVTDASGARAHDFHPRANVR